MNSGKFNDNDIETRRKWSGHWEFHQHGILTMTLKLVGTRSGHWEFHEHGTLRVVGDGALGVSKSMHYETLFIKESHSAQRLGPFLFYV